jgi:hypothetical protein
VPRRRQRAPAKPRRRIVRVDHLRFAAGWRLLDGAEAGSPAEPEPAVHVDLVRAADLVALSIDAVQCELVAGGNTPPALRPIRGENARLIVNYAYQHLGEQAIYEGPTGAEEILVPDEKPPNAGRPVPDQATPDGPDARPEPPIAVLPARSTRLVFALAEDESIEFSSAGILAALQVLEPLVHPLALPGDKPTTGSVGDSPFIILPGGLVAHLEAEGPLVTKATAALGSGLARDGRGVGAPPGRSALGRAAGGVRSPDLGTTPRLRRRATPLRGPPGPAAARCDAAVGASPQGWRGAVGHFRRRQRGEMRFRQKIKSELQSCS